MTRRERLTSLIKSAVIHEVEVTWADADEGPLLFLEYGVMLIYFTFSNWLRTSDGSEYYRMKGIIKVRNIGMIKNNSWADIYRNTQGDRPETAATRVLRFLKSDASQWLKNPDDAHYY